MEDILSEEQYSINKDKNEKVLQIAEKELKIAEKEKLIAQEKAEIEVLKNELNCCINEGDRNIASMNLKIRKVKATAAHSISCIDHK